MVKFAILGAGTIANKMALTAQKTKIVEPYAVAARDKNRAREFADKYGFEKAYTYDELFADPAVDLVYIAVPHSHHCKYMKLCLENGKNVLSEKPFTVNAEQAKEIIALSEKKGLLATEAMWTRYMPSRKIIDDIIKSGVIGDVKTIQANLGYELTGGAPRLWDPNLAGGALLDVGCYMVHFARMIFPGETAKVQASAVFRNGVDASNSISMVFENGGLATLQSSAAAVTDKNGAVFGTKGYIEIVNTNNPERVDVFDGDYKQIASYDVPKQVTGFEYELEAAAEAIKQKKCECAALPHAEIIACMETLDEIRRQIGLDLPISE